MVALRKIEPITIPATNQQSYVSFLYALNLFESGEDTGGWHFRAYWFHLRGVSGRMPPLAGIDGIINTNPLLAAHGVRDMGHVLVDHKILVSYRAVYVANHFRAIADLAYEDLITNREPLTATVREINAWLHTEVEIELLRAEYLLPLRAGLSEQGKGIFDTWIKTLIWN